MVPDQSYYGFGLVEGTYLDGPEPFLIYMSWRVAESLEVLRRQLNEAYPNRSKLSDGGIGDLRHQKSKSSDHNPHIQHKGKGIVTARDYTHDPAGGLDCNELADALINSRDPRIKYIIWNKRILSSKTQPWKWRPYSGVNAHTRHLHLSVDPDPKLFDAATPWDLGLEDDVARVDDDISAVVPDALLKRGSKGLAVGRIQNQLITLGYSLKADNIFGPATERAVKGFQLDKGLRPDGMVGPNTIAALAEAISQELILDLSAAEPPDSLPDTPSDRTTESATQPPPDSLPEVVQEGSTTTHQTAENIINTGDALPADFVPEPVMVTAPPPTGFMQKLKTHAAALLAFIGGGAGLKEYLGVQLGEQTVTLLKFLIPTVLGFGFIGFVVWYITEKIVGYKTLALKATLRSDPTKHNPYILPGEEPKRWWQVWRS